ncbi:MAG TPA: alpha/beta hydrolase [Roseiflexaceae bacterium]|nr:alpha/beta hydrolase [Roseiflexaceae bacterium]
MSETIPLWPGKAPGSENWRQREKDYIFREPWPHRITRNVVTPTLTLYLPRNATGTGVVVAPGGAHHFLAVDHEGVEVANWLTARGIAAFVLKYRVIETSDDDQIFLQERLQIMERLRDRMAAHWPLALADGQQAIRLVRQRAAEWGVRPDRIGMLGFSAGGHLAAGVALANEPASRPDFIAPIYGVVRQAIHVPANAPPLFIALASDDPIAVDSCVALFSAWQAAGRPAEIHSYAQGGHGFGMVRLGLPVDGWPDRFAEWLAAQGLLG